MFWLNWRQYRWPLLIGALLVVLLCMLLVRDGLLATSLYAQLGCQINNDHCFFPTRDQPIPLFYRQLEAKRIILPPSDIPLLLPLLVGVFVGAPVLPLERRVAPLMLTQGTTLRRWLVVKLGLVALTVLIFSAVLSLVYTWHLSIIDTLTADPHRVNPDPWIFYDSGIVLIGRSLFALLVGVTLGALMRRTIPTMIVNLLFLILVLSIGERSAARYLIPPLSHLSPISITQTNDARGGPGDLSLYAGYADQNGRETGEISTYCGSNLTIQDNAYAAMANQCIREKHLQWKDVYQPASRYWPLQIMETSLLCLLSLALLSLIHWLWRRQCV